MLFNKATCLCIAFPQNSFYVKLSKSLLGGCAVRMTAPPRPHRLPAPMKPPSTMQADHPVRLLCVQDG